MRLINPESLAPPHGYNNGVMMPAGSILCIAGQVGWDREHRLVGDTLAQQFDRALANVLAVVEAAGGRPESIAKLTIYVTDKAEYVNARSEIGHVYRRHMGRHFPAMSLVEVKSLLEPGAMVEIEGLAVVIS